MLALVALILAPTLVAISTIAARWWGDRIGGLLSAFPVVVGPVLLIGAHEHGARFAAASATGALVGLVAFSGFVLGYAHTAGRRWFTGVAVGWSAAIALSALLQGSQMGASQSGAAGALSLLVAYRLLPKRASAPRGVLVPRINLPLRMILTAALVAGLSTLADLLGSRVMGELAVLPVLASLLAVFVHRDQGAHGLIELLRGMLIGMLGFAGFCEIVAVLIVPAGTPLAFLTATITALALQGAGARRLRAQAPWRGVEPRCAS